MRIDLHKIFRPKLVRPGRPQRGIALVYVSIITVLTLSLVSIFMINMASQLGYGSVDFLKGQQAYEMALSGVDYMIELARVNKLEMGTTGPITIGTGSFTLETTDVGNNYRLVTITGEASGYERVLTYRASTRPKPIFPDMSMVDDAPDGFIPGSPQETTLDDEGSVMDAYVYERSSTSNYGTKKYIRIGRTSEDGRDYNGLVKLDLTFIPMGRTVTSAIFQMRLTDAEEDDEEEIACYRITRQWIEDEVTWRQAEDGVNWSDRGGDYDSDRIATADARFHENPVWVSWDITSSVVDMYNGVYPNYGWLFKYRSSHEVNRSSFDSREYYECYPSNHNCVTKTYYPPRLTVVYSGLPVPEGLQIYSNAVINGDLFVRGNVIVADGTSIGDPPNDPTTIYVPVGDTVASNELDSYFSWSTLDSTPTLAFSNTAVVDSVDSLINIAQSISHSSGNKYSSSKNWSNTTLDLSNYDENRIYVNGNVELRGVTIPDEDLFSPGMIIADGNIRLRNRNGEETDVGDNIILIAYGNITFEDATTFGNDYSAMDKYSRPETCNMAWAHSYYTYGSDGEIEVSSSSEIWATMVSYNDATIAGTFYGGIFCLGELDFNSDTYFEGGLWTSSVNNNSLSHGTYNITNIYPSIYFAGRQYYVDGNGFAEE